MVEHRERPFVKRRPRDDRQGSRVEPSVDTADWLVALEGGQGVPHPTVALIAAVYVGLRAIRRSLARVLGLALR
jgi:hypothetical protein